jgi:6-phosphogluconolactonase
MRGEDDPAQAAVAYEAELRQIFGIAEDDIPTFDLLLTGMGSDGHTLSLFPHTNALDIANRLVVANHVPQVNANRITFTKTLANAATLVAFVIAGADKADALAEVLEGASNPAQYPSQLIVPTTGELVYLVDAPAAAKLTNSIL